MRLAGDYLAKLEIRPVAGTSLIKIKFTTPDPALSARLANAHANSYLRYGVDLRVHSNDQASEFLKQRLTKLKERVEQSETALNSYRKNKGFISVDEKENVIIDRWLDLNKNLNKAEAERIGLEAQIRSIRDGNFDEIPAVRNNPVISGLKSELAKSAAGYAALSKEFKPGYPPLDSLKTHIDENRRRLQSEIQSEVRKIEVIYNAAKNNEAALRGTTEEQKKAALNLKDSAVQYAMLAHDVETNKQLYAGVLQRSKEIGVAAEVRSSNIYLMGKAEPPLGPSYPDSNGILMRGLLLGLLAGVGLAFLLDQLDNTIKSPEEAERFIHLPTLGVVPDFAMPRGARIGYMSKLVNSAKAELPGRPSQDEDRPSVLDHHPRIAGRRGLPLVALLAAALPGGRAAAYHAHDQCDARRRQDHHAGQHRDSLRPTRHPGTRHRRRLALAALPHAAQDGKQRRPRRSSDRPDQPGRGDPVHAHGESFCHQRRRRPAQSR